MKKLALVISLLICFGNILMAQAPYTNPTGDTLTGRDSTYFYSNWYDTVQNASGWETLEEDFMIERFGYNPNAGVTRNQASHHTGTYTTGRLMYAPRSMSVIGIAASAEVYKTFDIEDLNYYSWEMSNYYAFALNLMIDTTIAGRLTEYLQLYVPKSKDGWDLAAQAGWNVTDSHRYIHLPNNRCRLPGVSSPLYEVYFDHPYTVQGPFVVAGTRLNNHYDSIYNSDIHCALYTSHHPVTRYTTVFHEYNNVEATRDSIQMFDTMAFMNEGYTTFTMKEVWQMAQVIFPIFDTGWVPPVCMPVENLRCDTSYQWPDRITLMWDGWREHERWQLAYGPAGMDPDTVSNFYYYTQPYCTLTTATLDTGVRYVVYVRGWCDSVEDWSPWSDSLSVMIGHEADTTGHGDDPGTQIGSVLQQYTHLYPNPAHGMVQVISSFGLRRLEAYTLDGRKVLDTPATGISAAFDTKDWPAGTYIVSIRTSRGTLVQKLVVE